MGVVFLAEDLVLKRRVALKLLPAHLADESSFTERFLRESELAASLDHPNVIPVYAAGDADGRLFLAMRYVKGPSLRDLTRMGPLEPAEAFAITVQVAGALDAAHAHGLVHRDVKPSNVLIAPATGPDGSDHVYLADFGLSRKLGEQERRGAEERLMGTVEYAAPEQIRGADVDGRADVYALSCLLYECLTGVPPFQRRSAAATLFAHMEEEPPLASRRNPRLPPAVDAVLTRGLAKSPAERYQSCRQLVDDARQALGVSGRRGQRALRPPLAIVLTALTVALALAGLAVALTHRDEPSADTGRALLAARIRAPLEVPGDSVARINPETNKVVAAIAAPPDQIALAVGATSVWVGTAHDYGLIRIDPATDSQLPAPELPLDVNSVASTGTTVAVVTSRPPVGAGGPLTTLWLLGSQCPFYAGGGDFCAIPLRQRRPASRFEPFSLIPLLGSDADQIWITDPTGSTVSRLDPHHQRLVDTVAIPTRVGGR
jgi:serine/threonine-protein kinase